MFTQIVLKNCCEKDFDVCCLRPGYYIYTSSMPHLLKMKSFMQLRSVHDKTWHMYLNYFCLLLWLWYIFHILKNQVVSVKECAFTSCSFTVQCNVFQKHFCNLVLKRPVKNRFLHLGVLCRVSWFHFEMASEGKLNWAMLGQLWTVTADCLVVLTL